MYINSFTVSYVFSNTSLIYRNRNFYTKPKTVAGVTPVPQKYLTNFAIYSAKRDCSNSKKVERDALPNNLYNSDDIDTNQLSLEFFTSEVKLLDCFQCFQSLLILIQTIFTISLFKHQFTAT